MTGEKDALRQSAIKLSGIFSGVAIGSLSLYIWFDAFLVSLWIATFLVIGNIYNAVYMVLRALSIKGE